MSESNKQQAVSVDGIIANFTAMISPNPDDVVEPNN